MSSKNSRRSKLQWIGLIVFFCGSLFWSRNMTLLMKHSTLSSDANDERSRSDLPSSNNNSSCVNCGQATANDAAKDSTQSVDQTAPQKKKFKAKPTWWKRWVPKLARVWQPQSQRRWCIPENDPPTPWILGYKESAEGMIYIKSYKTGSSTCEGIAWNIMTHVGKRIHDRSSQKKDDDRYSMCKGYTRHEFANQRMHSRRNTTRSLLWSFMRNPAKRDLSHVYHFEIGRNNLTMDPYQIQQFIENKLKGRQTRYLAPKKGKAPLWPRQELRKNSTDLIQYLNRTILRNYEFLGVTERMDESRAVMVLLWDLEPKDVVVLDSKRSGGYDDGGGGNQCLQIPRAKTTEALEDYFANRHPIFNSDLLLYNVVNASLDLTIDHLGRERVQHTIREIRELQQVAVTACQDVAVFPCSSQGKFQPEKAVTSCYVQDAGCGYHCVDQALENYQ